MQRRRFLGAIGAVAVALSGCTTLANQLNTEKNPEGSGDSGGGGNNQQLTTENKEKQKRELLRAYKKGITKMNNASGKLKDAADAVDKENYATAASKATAAKPIISDARSQFETAEEIAIEVNDSKVGTWMVKAKLAAENLKTAADSMRKYAEAMNKGKRQVANGYLGIVQNTTKETERLMKEAGPPKRVKNRLGI